MENATNIYDLIGGIICAVVIVGFFILMLFTLSRYSMMCEQKKKDFINSLDNEHDKSVIVDYENSRCVGLREFIHYRYYEKRARKENKKYDK